MAESLTIQFTLTRNEVVRSMAVALVRFPGYMFTTAAMVLVLSVVAAAFGVPILLIFGFGAVFILSYFICSVLKWSHGAWNGDPALRTEQTITFSEDEMLQVASSGSAQLEWIDFKGAIETRRLILLRLKTNNSVMMLPKRAFSCGQLTQTKAILSAAGLI